MCVRESVLHPVTILLSSVMIGVIYIAPEALFVFPVQVQGERQWEIEITLASSPRLPGNNQNNGLSYYTREKKICIKRVHYTQVIEMHTPHGIKKQTTRRGACSFRNPHGGRRKKRNC